MQGHLRTKLLVALVAALALSALLLPGGAGAQRAARQANDNASGGAKSKRVVGVRSTDSGNGSRVTITADDSLKDYSAYRSGDRFYVVLPKAAAGARGGGSGRGYSDMQVQQRGDSVVLSYRVQPGAKPRVEQKFNRLDVVFDVPGDAGQQAAANNAARQQQQQQQTPPAENRTPAAQQNTQTQAATNAPSANAGAERRQPSPEEAARAQNAAGVNTTPPVNTAGQPAASVDPAAENPTAALTAPTPEPVASATPAAEPQIAQAQAPAAVAPITTNQPAAGTQTGSTLGTFLIRNWALALVLALVVVGLGLILAARRTSKAAPAPVESLDDDSAAKLEEPRASRAREASARALRDASDAAQASTLDAAKASTVRVAEPVITPEPVSKTESVSSTETVSASDAARVADAADAKPLAAATALAGGAAAAKSRKQSRKDARQGAKRKKKGGRAEEETVHADEPTAAAPVAEESSVEELTVATPSAEETRVSEEPVVEVPSVEETAVTEAPADEEVVDVTTAAEVVAQPEPAPEEVTQEEPTGVAQPVTTEEVAEVFTEPQVAEHLTAPAVETAEPERHEVAAPSFETVAPTFETSEAATTEIAPFDEVAPLEEAAPTEEEAVESVVAEAHAPAHVTDIEPAFAPDPERVQAETRRLLEGEEYDRAVVRSRDAMARQMIAAELLSAIAGRNALKRERASAAFVEHGYFDETARDLREADAPAERSAAARAFAHLGDRTATPLLVAALEDPVTDVRRAAVEALGALRDPAAIEPLEALLERERNERNRIPPRVIRTAVEFCREGLDEAPAAELPAATQTAIPAVEATELAPTPEPETAPAEEPARVVDALPAEEPVIETGPEPAAEVAAAETAEETSISITPFVEEPATSFVEEAAGDAPAIAPEPAAEATGEPAHVPEPVHAEESFETVAETGIEPYAEAEQPYVERETFAYEAREGFEARPAKEVGIEPFVGREDDVAEEGAFDFTKEARESEHAALFDAGVDEVTREIEPVAADSSKELTPSTSEAAAGEWFDFDISEMSGASEPAASAQNTPEPATPEPVFELSSGETFTSPAAAEVEERAEERAPAVGAHAEATRDIEVTSAAEAPPFAREPEPARAAYEPGPAAPEKGLAPFDEFSSVPASIQQRIASADANERAAAIVELSHVDTDEAFQQICAAFDDQAREVRAAAARALYELRADRAESFTRALREATPERRREIGSAIAASGLAAESISQLTGESRERTYEAFSLLFLMAKAGEVQPLLRAIEGHPNNEVRLAVVKLLALSGQKEVLPAFRRLAVRGSLPTEVRSAVMEAIYQISSSQPTHA